MTVSGSEPGRDPLAFLPGALRYILHSKDCDNLGEFITPVPNWSVGEAFSVADGRRFHILKIAPFPVAAAYDAMWMVAQVNDELDL